MTKINKKLSQDELKNLENILLNYFIENKYFIESKYGNSSLKIKKTELTDNEKRSLTFLARDMINDKSRDDRVRASVIEGLVHYLMKKPNLQNEALWLAIKYEPKVAKYDEDRYDSEIKNILKILSKNKEVCFNFVGRYGFLKKNLSKLEDLFNIFDSQIQKETLFEISINSRLFEDLAAKTMCYKILTTQIRNQKKYMDFFNEFNNDNINILKSVNSYESMYMSFSKLEINKLNPNKEYLSYEIGANFNRLINYEKEKIMSKLELSHLSFEEKNDNFDIRIEAVNLNKERIEGFFLNYLTDAFKKNRMIEFNDIEMCVNNILTLTDKEILDKLLPTKKSQNSISKI